MATYVFRYDGVERYVDCDQTPTINRIVAMQLPLDDRKQREDMSLGSEDMIRYRITQTMTEMHERNSGKFESLSVVMLEKVEKVDDGAE